MKAGLIGLEGGHTFYSSLTPFLYSITTLFRTKSPSHDHMVVDGFGVDLPGSVFSMSGYGYPLELPEPLVWDE